MTDTNEEYNENNLEWPTISGDNYELASVLKELGYELGYEGRSGIFSRNSYVIETKEGVLTEEVLEEIKQDIEKAKKIIDDKKNEVVDKLFNENKYDEDGVFSYVVLGGHPSNPVYYDTSKYGEVYSQRLAHKGHHREYNHTYGYCLYDKEKLKKNKKKIFVFDKALDRSFCDISEKYGISFKCGNKEDGFSYIINGIYLMHSQSFDIDLNNPKEVEEALERHNLSWPTISATEHRKAEVFESLGYDVEHIGRSGFESRNSYKIMTKDRVLTKEVLEIMKKDFAKVNEIIEREKFKAFDDCFNEASTDENKVYALVKTGGTYYREQIPASKYVEVASDRIACTQDHRRGIGHTYLSLFFDEEKLKADKRKCIKIYVPKSLIGIIIGKKGANIKKMQEKYGKFFKVEQDPVEAKLEKISAIKDKFCSLLKEKGPIGVLEGMDLSLTDEKNFSDDDKKSIKEFFIKKLEEYEARQEQEKIRKRKEDIQNLQSNIKESFAEKFIDMSDEEIVLKTKSYLSENADKISVMPNEDEINNMVSDMQKSSQYLREVREFNHKETVEKYLESLNKYVRNYEAENGSELSFRELKEYATEMFEDKKALDEAYAKTVEVLTKEREDKKRIEKADKMFDKVVDSAIFDFLNSDMAEPHGENYFNSVGKARRSLGYEVITTRIFDVLDISDLAKEKTLYGYECNSKKFLEYNDKVIERVESFDANNFTLEEYLVVEKDEDIEEFFDEPEEITEEEKEKRKQKLKEAKKAYRAGQRAQKVSGGFEGLKGFLGGSEGR